MCAKASGKMRGVLAAALLLALIRDVHGGLGKADQGGVEEDKGVGDGKVGAHAGSVLVEPIRNKLQQLASLTVKSEKDLRDAVVAHGLAGGEGGLRYSM